MNRIICDICGSEYAESADRCPICGYARQGTEKIAGAAAGTAVRTKVRGGRFSAKNVKKRQKARSAAAAEKEKNPNKPLLIVIAVLLAAILLVSLYIAMRFFRGREAYLPAESTTQTTQPSETTAPPTISCAGIVVAEPVINFDAAGQQLPIELTLLPEDTTDTVTYESADPAVASVSETGLVTAVGSGYTTITIVCGEVREECTVACWFESETTAPAETTAPPETTQPVETTKATEPAALSIDYSDVSLFAIGESFTIRVSRGDQSISRSKVTWTSSNPAAATVENGVVTAAGPGTTTITASYNGQEASCIVRCQIKDTTWAASSSDVTLTVGESFRLTVSNNSGQTADVTWSVSKEGVVSVSGSTVTAEAAGEVTLSATVDGVTVSCIVRVR